MLSCLCPSHPHHPWRSDNRLRLRSLLQVLVMVLSSARMTPCLQSTSLALELKHDRQDMQQDAEAVQDLRGCIALCSAGTLDEQRGEGGGISRWGRGSCMSWSTPLHNYTLACGG